MATASTPTTLTLGELTEAERRLLESVRDGSAADFSGRTDGAPEIRGDVLRILIASTEPDWPALCGPLRVRGARITGALSTPPRGRGSDTGRTALIFADCTFDEPVDLSGGEFLLLRFLRCAMPAFIGAGLDVKADLDLAGSRLSGIDSHESELVEVSTCSVHVTNARIGGRLNICARPGARFEATGTVRLDGSRVDGELCADGALMDGAGEAALSARAARIGGNAAFTPIAGWRFKAVGEVILSAARVTGDVNFSAAVLFNPKGRALHAEDLVAETISLSDRDGVPFVASGRLNLLSATAGGMLLLSNARLWPGPDYVGLIGKGGPVCLNMQQTSVSNALVMSNVGALAHERDEPDTLGAHTPLRGWFLLAGARLDSIVGDLDSGWPAHGFLELQGATYNRFFEATGADLARHRIDWLNRQYPDARADAASYRTQPYEELSAVFRRYGRPREADAVAVEKIRQRLAARVEGPWARAFPTMLMLVARHGYSSRRAALSFVIFVLLGSAVYAAALWGFGQPFLPVEFDPEPTRYTLVFDAWSTIHARGCPGLMLPQYALDAALPIVDLGQASHCRFSPQGPARWLWSFFHAVYALAGAGLSAVAVLTLTGVLRRD